MKIKIWTEMAGSIETKHFRDELSGREIKYIENFLTNTSKVEYQTVGGTWVSIDITWGETHVFGKSYEDGSPCNLEQVLNQWPRVVRSIVLPETEAGLPRRQFTFNYNSDASESVNFQWKIQCDPQTYLTNTSSSQGWGSLSRMETPSGAIVTYDYSLDGSSWHQLGQSVSLAPGEGLVSKTITHDGIPETWYYSNCTVASATGSVTNPDGLVTTESFYPHDPALALQYGGSDGRGGLVYKINQSNKVVIERHWTRQIFFGANDFVPGGIAVFNPVIDAEYTTLLENNQPVKMSAKTFQHDFNGNVTQVTEYDWFDPSLVSRDADDDIPTGVPSSATILRTTTTDFHNPASNSVSANVYAKRSLLTALPRILNAPQQIIIGPSRTQFSYDDQGYGFVPFAGNTTRISQWDDVNNKWLDTIHKYDIYGNRIKTTQPKGAATGDPSDFVTTYTWDTDPMSQTSTYASIQQISVDPLNGTGPQTTNYTHDLATGAILKEIDVNGKTTTTDYTNHRLNMVDPFRRPGLITDPQNRQVRTQYFDQMRKVIIESDVSVPGDKKMKVRTSNDRLGRPVLTESNEDGTETWTISAQMAYLAMGRISFSTNPRRSAATATDGWTRTTRDTLGRVVEVATFAGLLPASPTNMQAACTGNTNCTGRVKTDYIANETTVTDQGDKERRSVMDGLGRLVQIIEAPNDNDYKYQANYSYDVLDNLIRVRQGGTPTAGSGSVIQTRSFLYDSLSRLLYTNNPEQDATVPGPVGTGTRWTMKYEYDDNGNLIKRTDARNVITNYSYDGLNRATKTCYSDSTPSVLRFYDSGTNGIGRLWKVENQTACTSGSSAKSRTTFVGYDEVGRVLSQKQEFQKKDGNWEAFTNINRTYYLSGQTKTQTYPSGNTLTYTYDAVGRLQGLFGDLADNYHDYTFGTTYNAAGQMTRETFGTINTFLYHGIGYNSRLQMVDASVGTNPSDAQTWTRGRLQFFYSNEAIAANNPYTNGTKNNGNVLRQEHQVPVTVTERPGQLQASGVNSSVIPMRDDYVYDPLNRLTKVTGKQFNPGTNPQESTIYTQAFIYDPFGNRKINAAQTSVTAGINNKVYEPNKRNNRLTGLIYDAAGNIINESHSFRLNDRKYDAENRMTQANAVNFYVYDGNGRRVRRIDNSAETWQIYGISGELLAEYAAGATANQPQREYGYRNGQLLIVAETSPLSVKWAVMDNLGTPRIIVDSTGGMVNGNGILSKVWRHDYLPFGEELTSEMAGSALRSAGNGYVADTVRQKLGAKERDTETGMDYLETRYLSSMQGRFTSPDQPFADQEEGDPQSWNLYSYVRNNPVVYSDPSGLWRRVFLGSGIFYEADQIGDTLSGLAGILGVSAEKLVASFGSDKVALGQVFDIGSFFTDLKGENLLEILSQQRRAYIEAFEIELVPITNSIETLEAGMPAAALARAIARAVARRPAPGITKVYQSITAGRGYVGITNNLTRRAAQHLAKKKIDIQAIPGLRNISRPDARAVEQALIELHGLGNAGALLNQINSIAAKNPSFAALVQRGLDILKGVGYPGI